MSDDQTSDRGTDPAVNDSNVLSFVTMVLGGLSVLIGPIFGGAGILVGIVARRRHERLANKALIVAGVGFAIGVALAIAFVANRN